MMLPEIELVASIDETAASAEQGQVLRFFEKLSQAANTKTASEAVDNILKHSFAAVGFGPILSVLKTYDAQYA